MKFGSYLIMPVQRIPRYKMLLSELLKVTGSKHHDYHDLLRALKMVEKIAEKVNAAATSSSHVPKT